MPFPRPSVACWCRLFRIHALLPVMALIALVASPALGQDVRGHGPNAASPVATPAAGGYEWAMEAIRPELRDDVLAEIPAGISTYRIDAGMASDLDAPYAITGHLELDYVNSTGSSIDTLPFRLYANGPDDEHDAQEVSEVTVDGAPVTPELSVSNSVLQVPFEEPLAPGEAATVEINFTATLPKDSEDHYGIFGYDSDSSTWAMAHWYPLVAGRDPSTGWVLDPPSRNGDPIFSDVALYDVTFSAARGWKVVTSGVATGETVTEGDQTSQRYVSGPVRDFTMIADDNFELVTTESHGITVNSWYNPGEDDAGRAVAQFGEQSVVLFDDVLGAYPYREMDLAPVEMQGAAGCEFPSLIYVGGNYYEGPLSGRDEVALEFTVAHEMVHQWFYGLVGNNQYAHAFIDEGLTNYLSASVYFERTYDEDTARQVIDEFIRDQFEDAVRDDRDPVVDQPTDDFPSGYDYVIAAYAKSPLGFEAIRQEIGDEAFFAGLQAYVRSFSFTVAEPDDLLAAFETASGTELDAIWDHWFEEQHGTDDVDD
jgi:hypothetical protein